MNRRPTTRIVATLWLIIAIVTAIRPGAAARDLKVLVATGGHGFERDPFQKVFAEIPELAVTHAEHAKESATVYDRTDLAEFDVLVLYDMARTITDAQQARLLERLAKGTGLVVMHHALASYQNWPAYERIIGGKYPEQADAKGPAGGYQHDVEVPVVVVAKDHPVTAGIRDFVIHDEIYWNFRTGPDITPLLTTTHPKSGKPLAWTRTEGRSRIVYLQLGHDSAAYGNPNFRKLVAQAIRWTAPAP